MAAEPTIDFALAQAARRLNRTTGMEVTTGGRTLTLRFRADDARWYTVHLAAGAVVADGEPVDDAPVPLEPFGDEVPEVEPPAGTVPVTFERAAAVPHASVPPPRPAPAPPPALVEAEPRAGAIDIMLTTLGVAAALEGPAHDALILAGGLAAIEAINRDPAP